MYFVAGVFTDSAMVFRSVRIATIPALGGIIENISIREVSVCMVSLAVNVLSFQQYVYYVTRHGKETERRMGNETGRDRKKRAVKEQQRQANKSNVVFNPMQLVSLQNRNNNKKIPCKFSP